MSDHVRIRPRDLMLKSRSELFDIFKSIWDKRKRSSPTESPYQEKHFKHSFEKDWGRVKNKRKSLKK